MDVVAELVSDLAVSKKEKQRVELRIKRLESELEDLCRAQEVKRLSTKIDGKEITATLCRPERVVYDTKTLKEDLGELWNSIVIVTEKVDQKKLEAAVLEGQVYLETVSKSAMIKPARAYFRLS